MIKPEKGVKSLQKEKEEKTKELAHVSFEIALLIKGFDGLLEILGGFFLLILNPDRMGRLTRFLLHHELSEDPKDRVANALLALSGNFSIDAQHFGIIYLLTHGMIKFIVIYLLWIKKLWAYPFAMVSLGLFIIYQIYRYTFSHSVWMLLLSLFDAAMILLTYSEYKRMKARFKKE